MVEDYDDFYDEEDDFEDYDDFDDEDYGFEDFDDFDDEIDYDNLDTESKEELDIFDEKPLELDSDYDINAVEVHISTQLTSQKIIQLMALDNLGVSIEIKYNWGKKKYSMTQINQVVDLFNEGKRSEEIADILEMPVANVNYIKSKYFDKINVKHYKRKYDDECRLKVKSLKEEGLKPKEISKELDIPVRSIYYILNKK